MNFQYTEMDIVATILLGAAVIHTFLVSKFQSMAGRFPEGSFQENLFHLLGEVEVVFGVWGALFIGTFAILRGGSSAIAYLDHLEFREPLFVFAIMTVAATKPILHLTKVIIRFFSRIIPIHRETAFYFSCLSLGALLGSFITEAAAMTVVALIMKDRFFDRSVSTRFKYVTLAVLFVNISVGGFLTPYAAPPILMVASKWNWDLMYVLTTFGWKAAIAVFANAILATVLLRSELKKMDLYSSGETSKKMPLLLALVHLAFLVGIVVLEKHTEAFMGLMMLLVGVASVTTEFQDPLKIRQSLLVGFFLAGLVILGGYQSWWLSPLIHRLDAFPLFIGTTLLTSITDNAALTYLGSQVDGVSEIFKYALVTGAVAGGGLTVIANAPNPAGYSILVGSFGEEGIHPLRLFGYAIIPTVLVMTCLWYIG